jgi:hypothetical protein
MADGYRARQSTGVHDPIYHRIGLIDDGSTCRHRSLRYLCLLPGVCATRRPRIRRTWPQPKQLWWTVPTRARLRGWAAGCLRRAVKAAVTTNGAASILHRSNWHTAVAEARSKLGPARVHGRRQRMPISTGARRIWTALFHWATTRTARLIVRSACFGSNGQTARRSHLSPITPCMVRRSAASPWKLVGTRRGQRRPMSSRNSTRLFCI